MPAMTSHLDANLQLILTSIVARWRFSSNLQSKYLLLSLQKHGCKLTRGIASTSPMTADEGLLVAQ